MLTLPILHYSFIYNVKKSTIKADLFQNVALMKKREIN